MHREGRGATQATSPAEMVATFVTFVSEVFSVVRMATVAPLVLAGTPLALHVTTDVVPFPIIGSALELAQLQPGPADIPVTVSPDGMGSITMVGLVEGTGPSFAIPSVHETVPPDGAFVTFDDFTTLSCAGVLSKTIAAAMQRAGGELTQAGSPALMATLFVTVVIPVFVVLKVATGIPFAPAETPAL